MLRDDGVGCCSRRDVEAEAALAGDAVEVRALGAVVVEGEVWLVMSCVHSPAPYWEKEMKHLASRFGCSTSVEVESKAWSSLRCVSQAVWSMIAKSAFWEGNLWLLWLVAK